MIKYQEAFEYIDNLLEVSEDKKWPLVQKSLNSLKELVDQTKSHTLEQVKKEWEEEGYSWIETKDEILLISNKKQIFIDKRDKMYSCSGRSTNFITYQEHQLLTKTFRALEV